MSVQQVPKIFWRDAGIVHALLNVAGQRELIHQPWVGASWEGFVIEQILGSLSAQGYPHQAHFLRTSDGREIDLILEVGRERWAIEIKLSSSPSTSDLARLNETAEWIRADRSILVTQTRKSTADARIVSCNLPWLLERIPRWAK